MDLTFILFEPQVPENVGAACRALKTMGFGGLRVVNSDVHFDKEAGWLAHGAGDLLSSIQPYDTLEEAVRDMDLLIGTSAKPRGRLRELHTPEALKVLILGKGESTGRVGLLFGREDRGLSNAELEHCDLLTSIPLAVSYPSLNLAQAVMLYAYSLSGVTSPGRPLRPSKNSEGQLLALKERVGLLLEELGYGERSKAYRWAQERLGRFNSEDVHFLHSLCCALEKKLR